MCYRMIFMYYDYTYYLDDNHINDIGLSSLVSTLENDNRLSSIQCSTCNPTYVPIPYYYHHLG
jgi:hypothetical protein